MTARVEEMNGSSKLEATSNTSKLEGSSNSGTLGSSLPVDSTCYAPTCTLNNPEGKSEATSNLCYSPSCRFSSKDPNPSADMNKSIITKDPVQDEKRDVSEDSKEVVRQDEKNIFEDKDGLIEEAGDVELVADLEALSALSLELEKTSDQEILGKGGVTKSEKLATQKKSLGGGTLNQDGSRPRSVLQELQDVISEESIPEENVESDHSQIEEERSERCAWEVKQFKKTFETLQLEIQSLEARIGKLEERKVARAGKVEEEKMEKVEEEQEEKMEKMILP